MIDYLARDCRLCGGRLDSVLHLGNLSLSDFPPADAQPEPRVPLDLCACHVCGTVQLRHTVPPDILFRQYWYRSGINEIMRAELADVVTQALAQVGRLTQHDRVVDVGANDGTLLAAYRTQPRARDITRIAFEPATNLQEILHPQTEVLIADYFPAGLQQVGGAAGRVKILTSIACFYAVDAPDAFVEAVADLLHPEGIWIVQFQDLDQMIKATAFDNITFEHLVYYSLASFEQLLVPHGLKIIDAVSRAINGGSYRLTVARGAHKPATGRVDTLRAREAGCQSWETLERFAWRVGQVREQITATVGSLREQGRTIDLYAASTKANTTLQYCGLGPDAIRQAWERSPEKVGRQTVTGIPIVSEETGRADPPDALLLGAWQFKDAFVQREADYLRRGGSMIVPLPAVEIVTGNGKVGRVPA
jgi:NDP-4-keto-2,6-dideoxyhexose 3-C-methyltransferase